MLDPPQYIASCIVTLGESALNDRLMLCTALTLLASCGGGGVESDRYQQAIDQANAKQAEAESLVVKTPCAQSTQCGTLAFLSPTALCTSLSYQAYSLVSSSAAAASSAAAEQNSLAVKAMALAPGPSQPCTTNIPVPPAAVCIANACTLPQ